MVRQIKRKIAKDKGATTIVYKEALGNDVGRSLGTYFAKGEIVLFIDGDFVIPASELYPLRKLLQMEQMLH